MAEEKDPRIITPMPPSLVKSIDDYRYKERIPSRAEAIRRLVGLGIGAEPFLLDLLRTMRALPKDAELDQHIEAICRLVEKGLGK
jgi:hypothetical protein